MRIFSLVLVVLTLTDAVQAQDRFVTLNRFIAPTLVENHFSGLVIGPPVHVTALPQHANSSFRPKLVPMTGARYLLWMANVGSYDDQREVIAVFDRRTRTVTAVPGIQFTPGTVQLVRDPVRPRVFVHGWAVLGGGPGHIGIVDEILTYRSLLRTAWIGTAFAYAPVANQFFVTRVGTFLDPSLRIVAFDADPATERGSFALLRRG